MKGLAMMLKALGINVTQEHIQAVEILIPQIPGRLNQATQVVNAAILNFDQRLKALELQNAEILTLLKEQNEPTGPESAGTTSNGKHR